MKRNIQDVLTAVTLFAASVNGMAEDRPQNGGDGATRWTQTSQWPLFTNDRTDDVPLAGGLRQEPGFCGIFHDWGFIGDSLSSGEFECADSTGKKVYYDAYEYSWGQRMCAYSGTRGDNYSQGGEMAKRWVERFWDNPKNKNGDIDAKRSPKQAYIIALGANDSKKIKAGDARKDINLEDYTKNADSFAGWYGGIIQRVKTIQPDAVFFVVTFPRGRDKEEYNAAIRAMASIFTNTYLVELDKYAPDYSDRAFKSTFYLQGHLNPAGYEFTAWMMLNYIDWIIRHNMSDFSKVGLMGTPYR